MSLAFLKRATIVVLSMTLGAATVLVVQLWQDKPVRMPDRACSMSGVVTHELTGRTLEIDESADLAFFDAGVSKITGDPGAPSKTVYWLEVFEFDSAGGTSDGMGFFLHFVGKKGDEEWEIDGVLYPRYPEGKQSDAVVQLLGQGEGLNADGTGGTLTASLYPANGGLAAVYDVELAMDCAGLQ